jgi:gamma-glutamylcyclotransferase (GGCT)/AIG2-like uncharacterized protein YtfP
MWLLTNDAIRDGALEILSLEADMSGTEQVFVYGTLRPPRADTPADDSRYYPQIAAHTQAVVPARVLEGVLYNLGTYPAARPEPGIIQGDLLTVTPQALAIMDRIEGHPTFFRRAKIEVQTGAGSARAWIYWAPKGFVIGRQRIVSGDWLKRDKDNISGEENTLAEQFQVDEALHALIRRFAASDCSWLSSVRPDGRAHSTPIWHVWYQGRAYIVTLSGAVKTKNILENPSVVIAHPDPLNPLIIEGWATPAASLEPQLQPLFKAKYDWDISTDPDYDTIIEITPTKLMAWGNHGEGRWTGSEVLQVRAL